MWIPPAYSPVGPADLVRGLLAKESAGRRLEVLIAKWYGAERALATASGTHALQVALQAAFTHRGRGGEEILALPAYNCYDLVSAAVWLRRRVLFYDLDPLTLAPVPESLAEVAHRAGVLVVANLFGFPLDWDTIREISDPLGIPVVEDAAQGLGAGWKGEAAGTFGDLTVLSFGRGKGWTGGSGGAVMARRGFEASLPAGLPPAASNRLAEGVGSGAIWLLARPSLYGLPARLPGLGLGETHYRSPSEPKAISPFAAALVVAGRDRSLAEVEVRRRNAAALRRRIGGEEAGLEFPLPVLGGETGDLRAPVLMNRGATESRKWGFYRGYPRVLPEVEAVRPLLLEPLPVPGAARLAAGLVTAATHSRSRPGRSATGVLNHLQRPP